MPNCEHLDLCPLCMNSQIVSLDRAFGFMECASCGYIFDNPRPTLDAIVEHYSRQEQYNDWVHVIEARDRLWRRRIEKMRRHAVPGSLMDVGAGIGQFLALSQPFFTEITGTEVSESAIGFARDHYGLTLHRGVIESLSLPAVDNLTMFHLLEHVPSPRTTLERCYQLIKPGGRLFICVPNDILSWTSRMRALKSRIHANGNSPVTGLPRCDKTKEIHLSHFTPKTLAFGVEAAGFKVMSLSNDPYYAASGWRLALHTANYMVHETLRLPTFQATWLVAERP